MRRRVSACSTPTEIRLNASSACPCQTKMPFSEEAFPTKASSRGPAPQGADQDIATDRVTEGMACVERLIHVGPSHLSPMPPSDGVLESMSSKNSRLIKPPCCIVCKNPEDKALERWSAQTSKDAGCSRNTGLRRLARMLDTSTSARADKLQLVKDLGAPSLDFNGLGSLQPTLNSKAFSACKRLRAH